MYDIETPSNEVLENYLNNSTGTATRLSCHVSKFPEVIEYINDGTKGLREFRDLFLSDLRFVHNDRENHTVTLLVDMGRYDVVKADRIKRLIQSYLLVVVDEMDEPWDKNEYNEKRKIFIDCAVTTEHAISQDDNVLQRYLDIKDGIVAELNYLEFDNMFKMVIMYNEHKCEEHYLLLSPDSIMTLHTSGYIGTPYCTADGKVSNINILTRKEHKDLHENK